MMNAESFISYRNILNIAVPMMIGGLSMNIVSLADTLFISELGAAAIGGAGNAIILFFTLALTGFGLTTGLQIFIGKMNGAENYRAIGRVLGNGLMLIWFFSFSAIAFLYLFLELLTQQIAPAPDVGAAFRAYIDMRWFGLPFLFSNAVFIAFCVGTTRTRVITPIMVGVGALNLFLDYALVFGEFGFPALGVQGAALASNISEALGSIAFALTIVLYMDRGKYGVMSQINLRIKTSVEIIRLGAPLMLQNFLSIAAWIVFFAAIARMGTDALASSHILRTVYIFVLLPVFSLCDTSNSGISNLIGMERPDVTRLFLWRLLLISFVFCLATTIPLWIFEREVLLLFNATPSMLVTAHGAYMVMLVAIFSLPLGFILFKAVSGTGKTMFALYFELVAAGTYAIYSLVGLQLNFELHQMWYVEILYFGLLALLSFQFLKRYFSW